MTNRVRRGLLAAGALMLALPGLSQQWLREQVLHRPGLVYGSAVAVAAPDGFTLVGDAAPPNSPTFTYLCLTRLTLAGDTLWQRLVLQGPTHTARHAVFTTARGSWLATSDTMSPGAMPYADSYGSRLWQLSAAGQVQQVLRPLPWLPGESPEALLPASDGGLYALLTNRNVPLADRKASSLLCFDSTGRLRWRRHYGWAVANTAASLCYTPSGTLLLAGSQNTTAAGFPRLRLLELGAAQGDSLRGRLLPLPVGTAYESMVRYNDLPFEAVPLLSGGYVLACEAQLTASTYPTGTIIRLDNNLNAVWRYTRPPVPPGQYPIFFTQVRELADGSLLALACSESNRVRTFWLYRLAGNTGALLAIYPCTPAPLLVRVHHLLPAADSTLLVMGDVFPGGRSGDLYLGRLRIPGLPRIVTAAVSPAKAALQLEVHPNPAQGFVRVTLPGRSSPGVLELRDTLGRVVRLGVAAPGVPVGWSLAGVSSGLYLVVLRGAGPPVVRHLVVE
jgi:hypothetical protein